MNFSDYFSFGFNLKDFVRSVWAALFAGLTAFFTAAAGVGPIANYNDGKAAVYAGAVAAGAALLAAIKNTVLADTNVKG